MRGYELTNFEWDVVAPLLPNKPRGVPRVDDRRVLNGIFWVLRTGAPWRALPKAEFGPYTTCYNRFVLWRKAGVWDRVMAAVSQAYDGDVQMIDDRAPGSGVGARGCSRSPAWSGRFCQAATAGSLTKGSSLKGAMVSRVM
jgi:transposase